jgi:hypothetical protein
VTAFYPTKRKYILFKIAIENKLAARKIAVVFQFGRGGEGCFHPNATITDHV